MPRSVLPPSEPIADPAAGPDTGASPPPGRSYIHGYSLREAQRLGDQADTLSGLLHEGVSYGSGRRVLECGCGAGAQTVWLASASPHAHLTSVDISPTSLALASARVGGDVSFLATDVYALPFDDGVFDDVFVCFVLEHLPDPAAALGQLRRVLRRGGSITVIEGDHGSWYSHPQTPAASRAVECLIEVQRRLGGDSTIGRRLYPLLVAAGFADVTVEPRSVYVDDSRPELVRGFSVNTFIAMVEGAREQAIAFGLIDAEEWAEGVADLYRATEPDGTFNYTFFRATARC